LNPPVAGKDRAPAKRRAARKGGGPGARVAALEAELARQIRVNEALRDVALALGRPLDLDHLLELILARAAELLEADRATLYLIEEPSGELVSRHVVGGQVETIRLKAGEGIAGSVLRSGRAIRVDDAYADPRFEPSWDRLTGYATRTILALPMKNHKELTIGVLQVLNKRGGGGFSDDDEAMLGSLATQAAISIDNAKLYLSVVHKNLQIFEAKEKLERKVADLKLMFDLESAMARAATQQDLARGVLSETVAAARARAGSLLLSDAQGSGFSLYRYSPEDGGGLGCAHLGLPAGFVGQAMAEARPVVVAPGEPAPPSVSREELGLGLDVRSAVAVPLLGDEDAPMGAVAIYERCDDRPFGADDLEMLRLVAANVFTAICLQRARSARETAERLSTIGRLLSGVLHDLKSPLTVISGYVQLMAITDERAKREEYSEIVLKQFDHVQAMQKEVLAFARGESTMLLSRVYLVPFFEEIADQIRGEIGSRPVKLVLDLEDRGAARLDQAKIRRAVHNLARNALEAMGERGGTITLDVTRDGADLVLRVSDTGPGIPAHIEASLFESFVTAGKKGGTGLGLAIVKKVVEEHGGSVAVASSERGACFTLRLPATPGARPAKPEPAPAS
jgi:signal transduction histidine kinase/putative methionine-R-sulfoxide reductase with GAF domain